jgi:hypothetical protein
VSASFDRRSEPRLPVVVKAEFRVDGTTHDGQIINLGDSAVFLATPADLKVGTRGFLRFRHAENGVVVRAAVVRRREQGSGGIRGVALEFRDG